MATLSAERSLVGDAANGGFEPKAGFCAFH
jgi:hypothetical protein